MHKQSMHTMMANTMDVFIQIDEVVLSLIDLGEFKWTSSGDFNVFSATKDGEEI